MDPVKRLEIQATSSLTPEQLEVHALFDLAGVQLNNSTFKALWTLVSLNIPTSDIINILEDIAKKK